MCTVRYSERQQTHSPNFHYNILLKMFLLLIVVNPSLCLTYKLNYHKYVYREEKTSLYRAQVLVVHWGSWNRSPADEGDFCAWRGIFPLQRFRKDQTQFGFEKRQLTYGSEKPRSEADHKHDS